ncbi:MAG: response regulator [SAR324 cluster bacterium]|nr:response regulator [SAR324 cluster bacterium]
MKILIVDDQVVTLKKMKKILEIFGDCELAEDGPEAIQLFKQSLENKVPFDLVMLDIEMPGIDGTEVLFELREIEKEFKVPKHELARILMVTSHSDKDTVITSVQAGCNDYVVKPINKETIVEKLGKLGFCPIQTEQSE